MSPALQSIAARLEAIMDHRRRQRVEAARKERFPLPDAETVICIAGECVVVGTVGMERPFQ